MVGGKAFATYTNAKRIVKLVTDVGAVVNNDPDVNKYLKVSFFSSMLSHPQLFWKFILGHHSILPFIKKNLVYFTLLKY
jgi:hypothetical protein